MSAQAVGTRAPLLTHKQMLRLQRLAPSHRVVGAKNGSPIVQRRDGQLLLLQPNGRMLIERVQSYLHVDGG